MELNKLQKKELIALLKKQGRQHYSDKQDLQMFKELNVVKDNIIIQQKIRSKSILGLCGSILKSWGWSNKIWLIVYYMGAIMGIFLGLILGGAF